MRVNQLAQATETNTTRRAILAGAGALSVATAANAAAIAKRIHESPKPEADPIFAAIEEHREARRLYHEALDEHTNAELAGDDVEEAAADELVDETSDDEFEEMWNLVATVPTTVAGVLAVLQYVNVRTNVDSFTSALPDHVEESTGYPVLDFLRSIETALRTMAVQS